jgi:hypothetical protein
MFMLPSYDVSAYQLFSSLFISEYGLRHFEEAKKNQRNKWIHIAIGAIEVIPVIGAVVSTIERLAAEIFKRYFTSPQKSTRPSVNIVPIHIEAPIKETSRPVSIPNPAKSSTEGTIICPGNQVFCSGWVPVKEVKAICQKLNESRPVGVQFDENSITDQLVGGTCSAMSLDFIHHYLNLKGNRQAETEEELFTRVLVTSRRYEYGSSPEFRVQQAAFNAIQKVAVERDSQPDFTQAKMASLMAFHHRKIVYASEMIDFEQKQAVEKTKDVWAALPQGIFIVRAIRPKANHKEEKHGHTMVLVNESQGKFFYDPNHGTRHLRSNQAAVDLYEALKRSNTVWDVPEHRFYQVV